MNRVHGYEIRETIRTTLASALYRARRASDDAPVLLRVLRTDGTRIADIARFKHEYEAVRHLASPHVLAVLGVEELPDGLLVVLADFVGEDLATHLQTHGPLAVTTFLHVAIAIAEALEDIHRLRLLHGDLRPHNLMIGPGEAGGPPQVVVLGFGVEAEITREHEAIYNPTVLADVLPYLSPEKTGRMNRSIDAGADLYSLGVVLYELLAGRPPFTASDPMELFHAHIALLPPALAEVAPHVPPAISAIVRKLLGKNAEDRYHGASGLKADLLLCQQRLAQGLSTDDLIAGARDSGELFKLHQKLYGRQQDIERLVGAFHEVLGGRREIVLVSGYSGIGKSSLVQEILKPLAREKGYYIAGKYDQYNRDMPYSAILQAFEGLVRQLLAESEVRIRRWRAAILEALGANGQVLCEVLPSLTHIIGEQPPIPALGPVEAQNRFTLYFEHFVAVFARAAHPLVLFLDDLQWIDAASLALLRSIVLSEHMQSLFFCGAYRNNEVSPAHPFMRAREELLANGTAIRDIVLAPLNLSHLVELIGDSLRNPRCGALAEVVLRKTGGNPFFAKQFMRSLHEQEVLVYEAGPGWQWNLRKVESLQYTANVVDLMAATIRRLPPATQEALNLAATIGNRFDLTMLATVSECSVDQAYARLDRALQEGLLVSRGEQIHFVHDKVQEAAYSLIPAAQRPAVHLQIGRLLQPRLVAGDRQALFDITGHFNSARALLTDPAERLEVARLNLLAAEKAEESAAFVGALRYLSQGATLLPDDAWDSQYELMFAYATRTGMMQSLCDMHDAAIATLGACLPVARGRLDLTAVRRLIMHVQVLKNDLPAALDEGLSAVRLFGIDLPPFPDDDMLAAELQTTLALLGDRVARLGGDADAPTEAHTLAALTDLAPLQDAELAALQDTMQELFAPCYFLATNNYPIMAMKIVQNALRFGVSRNTVYGYSNFGAYLCAGADIELGYLFGRAAVRVDQLHPDKKQQAMLNNMWGAFIQHWKEPYARYKESLVAGLHIGIETGQYIWAFYNTVNSNTNSLLRGALLPEVLAESKSYLPMWRLDKFNAITWMVGAVGQIAHNLSVPVDEPHRLQGEWLDIIPIAAEAKRINSRAAMFFANFYQVVLGVFQGAALYTARICDDTDPSIVGIASWHGTPAYHFYGAIAYTLAHDQVEGDLRLRYLANATAFAAKLGPWARLNPASLQHRDLLLRAELARLAGDVQSAAALYDDGIAAAATGGFIQDEALGNELCGRFFAGLGRQMIARAYLTEAHRRYGRWGADQVMARLEREWPDLLGRELGHRPGAARDSIHVEFDVRSVLKASQALSGEIVLSRLLERLLDIILENAGASRGVLLLRDDGGLKIEAGRDLDLTRPPIQRGTPLEDSIDVAISVVQYVARTEEDVVLADVASEGTFASDPYIVRHAPRSLLASLIRYQGRPAGVIYVENSLAAGAFTPERVEMLRLLSAQAAISIENALLYARLEEMVAQRIAELRGAHEHIVALGRAQQERQELDLNEKQSLIKRQQELIRALSTPIIEVWDGVLTAPIVGSLDDGRAMELTENLLERIARSRSRHAIIDLTGVDTIDTATAMHLVGIVRAVKMLGATATITGLSPAAAQTIVELGLDLRGLTTRANLREALRNCMTDDQTRRRR